MTVDRYATRAGKAYEGELLRYAREQGLDIERLRLTGEEDEGDHLIRAPHARYVVEAKREKGFNLAAWVKEAERERDNYDKHRGYSLVPTGFVVIHKARGKGIGHSYVTTTLDEWIARIK